MQADWTHVTIGANCYLTDTTGAVNGALIVSYGNFSMDRFV